MNISIERSVKPWIRKAVAPLRPQVAVLLYHRIFEPDIDPWDLSVSARHFEEHLICLQKHFNVYKLSQLDKQLAERRLPRRGVIITFDDGYADNFTNAVPLLEKYELPATIFVTSGAIGSGREFWWDSLERIFLRNVSVPDTLSVQIGEERYGWSTGNNSERAEVFWTLHPILQSLPSEERERVMDKLLTWAGLDRVGRSDYHPMTTAELRAAAQSPYIDIGGHTVTHASLADLSISEQFREMVGGRKELESLLDTKIEALAYPYGRYNEDSLELAAGAEFKLAFTVESKLINKRKNPLRLGRFGVEDWSGENFKHELEKFFRS